MSYPKNMQNVPLLVPLFYRTFPILSNSKKAGGAEIRAALLEKKERKTQVIAHMEIIMVLAKAFTKSMNMPPTMGIAK